MNGGWLRKVSNVETLENGERGGLNVGLGGEGKVVMV